MSIKTLEKNSVKIFKYETFELGMYINTLFTTTTSEEHLCQINFDKNILKYVHNI